MHSEKISNVDGHSAVIILLFFSYQCYISEGFTHSLYQNLRYNLKGI